MQAKISCFVSMRCRLQDSNPNKYSIGEAIIKPTQMFSDLDGAILATVQKKQVFVRMR